MKNYDNKLNEIVEFTRHLVRVPSQGFIDKLDPIFGLISEWLKANSLDWEFLYDSSNRAVAILVTVDSGNPGPAICLDACVDTAPVGQRGDWKVDPFAGMTEGGKICGRGVGDSKVAVSIFCHIAREVQRSRLLNHGVLYVLLDGDEHTGNFGGVKAFIEGRHPNLSFVAIGYPGNYGVVIGARGFYRGRLFTFGKESHSGSRERTDTQNAIVKMSRLIDYLSTRTLPIETDPDFSFGPKLSVTEIGGGGGFSQIPGKCEAKIDIRLTPHFAEDSARRLIDEGIRWVDAEFPTSKSSFFETDGSWPWYKLNRESAPVQILGKCAEEAFKKSIAFVVCGPSNIGNYLAAHRIPATCGLGVSYENLHAPNECVNIDTILPTYETYLSALSRWADIDFSQLKSQLLESASEPTLFQK